MAKENNLYSIKNFALKTGSAVITPSEIANILGKSKKFGNAYAARMVKKILQRGLCVENIH